MTGDATMDGILVDTLWILGLIGIALATLAGLWLVAAPRQALSLAQRLNREFSVSWVQRLLDAPRSSEPLIYRRHRVVGALLVVATAYFFWQYLTAFDRAALVALYAGSLPAVVLEILATAFTVILVLGNAVGLVLGFIIFFRPSLLKGAEGWANRWVAADRAVEVLDRRSDRPESFTSRYPRRVGAVILLATLYILLIAISLR